MPESVNQLDKLVDFLTSLSIRLTFRFFKIQIQSQFQTGTLPTKRCQRHGLKLKLRLNLKLKSVKIFAVLINLSIFTFS